MFDKCPVFIYKQDIDFPQKAILMEYLFIWAVRLKSFVNREIRCYFVSSKSIMKNTMKNVTTIVSPYILLLLPIFMALVLLVINIQPESLQQDVELQASFFSIPRLNVCEVISGFFH